MRHYILFVFAIQILFSAIEHAFRFHYDLESRKSSPNISKIRFYGVMYHFADVFGSLFLIILLLSWPAFFRSTLIVFICKPDAILFLLVKVIIGYCLMRFFIFDVSYNLFTRRNIQYIGRTSLSDIILRKIPISYANLAAVMMLIRMLCLMAGCGLILM